MKFSDKMGYGSAIGPGKAILLGLVICATITSLTMAIVTYAKFVRYQADVQGVIDNWTKQPIVSYAVVDPGLPCPANYNLMDGVWSWPGTSSYCDCTFSFKYVSHKGTCTSNQTRSGCDTKMGFSPIPLYTWSAKRLCIQRAGQNALDRPALINNGQSCPIGWRLCGIPSNYTGAKPPSYATCQPVGMPCASASLMTTTCPLPSQYTIPWSGSISLNWNLTGDWPVVDLMETPGSPCQIGTPGWPRSDTSNLLATSWSQGCTRADTRFIQFAMRDEYDLYVENNIPRTAADGSSLITQFSMNVWWRLSFRREIQWSDTCSISRQDLIAIQPNVQSLLKAQLALMIIYIIFDVLSCCGFCVAYFDSVSGAKRFIGIGVRILRALPLIAVMLYVTWVNGVYANVIGKSVCSDPVTNSTFELMAEAVSTTLTYDKVIVYLDAFVMLLLVAHQLAQGFDCFSSHYSDDKREFVIVHEHSSIQVEDEHQQDAKEVNEFESIFDQNGNPASAPAVVHAYPQTYQAQSYEPSAPPMSIHAPAYASIDGYTGVLPNHPVDEKKQ